MFLAKFILSIIVSIPLCIKSSFRTSYYEVSSYFFQMLKCIKKFSMIHVKSLKNTYSVSSLKNIYSVSILSKYSTQVLIELKNGSFDKKKSWFLDKCGYLSNVLYWIPVSLTKFTWVTTTDCNTILHIQSKNKTWLTDCNHYKKFID